MKATPISTIASLPDKAPIFEIQGTVKQVWAREEKESKDGKPYRTQALLLTDPTGSQVLVRMFNKPEAKPEHVGRTLLLTADGSGGGIEKNQYVDKQGETKHSVTVGRSAIVRYLSNETQPPVPAGGNQQQAAPTQQRASGPSIKGMVALYAACWDAVAAEAKLPEADRREIATCIFIEANRKGITLQAPQQPKPVAPPPAPEIKAGDLAAYVMGQTAELQPALASCSAETIDKAFDLLDGDLKLRISAQALDAAFESLTQGIKPQQRSAHILRNWPRYVSEAEAWNEPVAEKEVGMAEDEEIIPDISFED